MQPIFFLLIPVAVFAVGSALLWLRYRYGGTTILRRDPAELSHVAPVIAQRHDAGWRADQRVRSTRG